MFKRHHKMRCWNREFQYLPAKIIGKIVKCQYLQLKPYTFQPLTSLCPPCLTFLSLLSSPGSDSTLNHSLSLLDTPYLNLFSCISSEGWARSWLFLRPCVRPSPILGEAQNICFCTILSEIPENHLCILQYLATVAFKTLHKIDTFFVKCSKHTIKWKVEIVNFSTSQLKS